MNQLGIYIHIPYCRSKCPYCDFFSLAKTDTAAAYIAAVERELECFAREHSYIADTLYIGGGTPSVLAGKQIASLISTVRRLYGDALEEVTVEGNPSDVSEDFLRIIRAAGANRLSLGMQSAVESERRALGRRAGAAQVSDAVEAARRAGFGNISLDLMLGIPAQSAQSLRESITFCADLGVEHISAYILKLEEGTYFYRNRDRLDLPDDDATADLYLQAVEELDASGFAQYEISNFAKPGKESRHNLKYWRLEEYLGIGAAAHSYVGGKRFYYARDIESFIAGAAPVPDGSGGDRQEQIMLGLRLKQGISKALLSEKAKEKLPLMTEQGLIAETQQAVALTPQGCLLSNTIINELSEV
ncbi:MAG: radical SAM family heme chaperone HemW [Ruminococcaceae bacterium]|nr:radical SAM family heme chaperone HemW [Oscillospiraceae bacterium]